MLGKKGDNSYIEYISLGFEIAVSLSAPILIGFWLDRTFETIPWLTLTGVFVGILAFGGTISRLVKRLNRKDRE